MTKTKKTNPWIAVLVLGALFLLFVVPYFFAFHAKDHPTDFFDGTTNYGTLITPAVDLRQWKLTTPKGKKVFQSDKARLVGRWMYIVVNFGACKKACEKSLYNIRQIRKATGKRQDRVLRAIVTNETHSHHLRELIRTKYHGTAWFVANKKHFEKVMHGLDIGPFSKPGTVYLVDPIGNVFMVYAPTANNSKMFKDLERLLKTSQIG